MGFLQLNVTNQNSDLDYFFSLLFGHLSWSLCQFPFSLWTSLLLVRVQFAFIIWSECSDSVGPSLLLSAATQMAFTCLTHSQGCIQGCAECQASSLWFRPLFPIQDGTEGSKWKRTALSHSHQLFHFLMKQIIINSGAWSYCLALSICRFNCFLKIVLFEIPNKVNNNRRKHLCTHSPGWTFHDIFPNIVSATLFFRWERN